MSASAGWFPDPGGRPGHYRWWDGSSWTRALASDPSAPAPEAYGSEPVPDHDVQTAHAPRHRSDGPVAWQQAGDVVTAQHRPIRPQRPPGYERPAHRAAEAPRTSLKSVLISIAVAVVVAAVVVAIALYEGSAEPMLDPPTSNEGFETSTPTPSPSAPPMTFDPTTRRFSMDGLEMTLPAAPYKLTPANDVIGSSLGGVGVDGTAVVQQDYAGDHDWTAAVSIGQLGSDHVGADLNKTADRTVAVYASEAFVGAKLTIKKVTKSTITKNVPRPVRIVTADIHYKIKGLHSKYDHVSVVVTTGKSGGYVAFLSSRPNNASPKIKKALQASIDTIHVT